MLDWRRTDGCWFGNGFRIRRVGETRWQLEENRDDGRSVMVDVEPIAVLPTLAACKHYAQTLHTRGRISLLRHRLIIVGFCSWALAVVAGHPIVFLAFGVVGSAALLELIVSYFDNRTGGARDLIQ